MQLFISKALLPTLFYIILSIFQGIIFLLHIAGSLQQWKKKQPDRKCFEVIFTHIHICRQNVAIIILIVSHYT